MARIPCPRHFIRLFVLRYMQQLTINTSKTPKGYSASCDLMPGWVVAYEGDFDGFKDYVRESIRFYVDCALADGEPFSEILASPDLTLPTKSNIRACLPTIRTSSLLRLYNTSLESTSVSFGTMPPDAQNHGPDKPKK